MVNNQDTGAISGSREPGPSGPGPLGFDPGRGADNIVPRLTPAQAAFILRMEPSVLDQEISQFDWDNIDCKVDNPDSDGWPYWHWFGGMRLYWPSGRATDNPEITFRFNTDGLATRERLCASAGEAGTATTVQQGVVHEHATRKGDAQTVSEGPLSNEENGT